MKISICKTIIIFIILIPLTEVNYCLRRKGILPDKWFWADELMLEWGYNYKSFQTKIMKKQREIANSQLEFYEKTYKPFIEKNENI